MNDQIQSEILLITNVDNVKSTEQIKIISICNSVLNSKDYTTQLSNSLNNIFNQPTFNLSSEFTRLLSVIVELNKKVEYYKEINEDRIKYVIYACFYSYLIKNNYFDNHDLGEFRLMYCNAWDLLSTPIETLKIAKESCTSCLSKFNWFAWLGSGKISIS